MSDQLTVEIDGREYAGWTAARIERRIDKMATDFDLAVTETWPGQVTPWQLGVFTPIALRLGGVLVLTGYIDTATPSYDGQSHKVQLGGRSKTADLVDCMSELPHEHRGTTLSALARAIAEPFGIGVVDEAPIGAAFPLASREPTDTAFQFLERQARLRGVLLTDDPEGRLVLTRAGESRAAGSLEQGRNIESLQVEFNVSKQFSKYIVIGQAPAGASWVNAAGEVQQPGAGAQPGVLGTATDPNVPRYRPHVTQAETGLTASEARDRAVWQAAYAGGRATRARVTVRGWRQENGEIWRVNQLVPIKSAQARLDSELLIVGVTYQLTSQSGRTTELLIAPAAGYKPDPAQVRVRNRTGGGGAEDPFLSLLRRAAAPR